MGFKNITYARQGKAKNGFHDLTDSNSRVAFGIMLCSLVNLLLSLLDEKMALRLILGSPAVLSAILMVAVYSCPESPRYYLRDSTRPEAMEKAYKALLRVRNTEVRYNSSVPRFT